MYNKLATLVLILSTGCNFPASGYGPNGRNSPTMYDQQYQDGSGPILVESYAECWRLNNSSNAYGWYFDATVEHSWGPEYITEIESVWVDIYFGSRNVTFELYDDYVLYYPLDAPGAEIFNYQTAFGDGIWMTAQHEATTQLNCDSNTEYEIYTTAYDYEGNYQTSVEYL